MRFSNRHRHPPVLGDLELDVMKQIWGAADRVDARTLTESLPGRSLSLSTIQATLERLHRKGLLARTKVSRAYHYRAAVSREQLLSVLIGDVVRRLSADELGPAISGFIDFVDETDPALLDRLARDARLRRNRE